MAAIELHFALVVSAHSFAAATNKLGRLLPNDNENCHLYTLLPATSLGSGLAVPNEEPFQISRTIFIYTALISVRAQKWTAQDFDDLRAGRFDYLFWEGDDCSESEA